jgi:hypothetical protein
MQIPIALAKDKVSRFLDCLSVELDFRWDFGRLGQVQTDGSLVQTTESQLWLTDNGFVTLVWTIKIDSSGALPLIEVANVTGESNGAWAAPAKQLVIRALTSAMNDDRAEIFLRQQFAYMGPVLDGEYWLPGFRLAPAALQEHNLPFAERVLYIDQNVRGVTKESAHSIGIIQARRYASLLTLFLDVGLYEIPFEPRWALISDNSGNISSQCVRMGFKDLRPIPTKMPAKGTECRLGDYRPVYRNLRLDIGSVGPTLQCPADIRDLVRGGESLPTAQREQFLGATGLFRIARIESHRLPSLAIAYAIAAVDAITGAKTSNFRSFKDTAKRFVPEVSDDELSKLYGNFRSGHFHAGSFPGGEFERQGLGLYESLESVRRASTLVRSHWVSRYVLISWLLDRSGNSA